MERDLLRNQIIALYLSGDADEILRIIPPHKRRPNLLDWTRESDAQLCKRYNILESDKIKVTICRPPNIDYLGKFGVQISKEIEEDCEVCPQEIEEECEVCPQQEVEWDPLLLWFRPNICCIDVIGSMLKECGLTNISSIGCGSGLLEWLIAKLKGINVIGYEVNETWWISPYSPPRFIPHVYADEDLEVPSIPQDHALLCCYFNNGPVFKEYLERYEGNCLIVIGSEGSTRKTEPRPLHFLHSDKWQLCKVHVQPTSDLICCYVRTK